MTQVEMAFGVMSAIASKAAKGRGLDRVEADDFVPLMRQVAERIARERGSVSSDDLRQYAATHGLEPRHPNAWGALFRGKTFRCIGRKKSELVSNHAREIRVWALAEV